MKKILLLVFFLVFPFIFQAQTDPIEKEISEYSPSQSELISKGRRLLLDSFIADDLDKVEEVKDFLMKEMADEHYTALYPIEHWLVLYWTEEFDELLELLLNFDQSYYEQLPHRINPPQDMLFANLQGKSVVWKDKLEWKIRSASVSEEEKDFLRLQLAWLLDNETGPDFLDKLNQRADAFLEAYPESVYEDFVRQELRYKYEASKWGLGVEFFTGYGRFSGELADSFSGSGAFGFGMDGEYDKLSLYLRLGGWIGKTEKELRSEQGTVWKKGKGAISFHGEAALGYAIMETDKIKFSPYVGIGVLEISAPEADLEKNPDLEELAVGPDVAYSLGGNVDFKLGWATGELVENKKTYWFVRLRYAYVMPQFLGDPGGNMHTLSLGLGGVFRGSKRVL